MPVYEYQCESCGRRFEVMQKFSDPEVSECQLCSSKTVRKILAPTAFVLKGTGWYATDYAPNSRSKTGDEKPCKEDAKKPAGCGAGACASGACSSKAEP